MAFFKRELGPVDRFEAALKSKQAERSKLADRLSLAESVLNEKRAVAEQLAVAGASNFKLERADAKLRAVEDRAKTLRAALAELDAQIASNERALSEARVQRERETRFTELFETLQEGVYFSTPDGRLLDCNNALVKLFGYDSKEQLLAAPVTDHYPDPSDRDTERWGMEQAQGVRQREIKLKKRDGTPIVCLDSARTVFDAMKLIVEKGLPAVSASAEKK